MRPAASSKPQKRPVLVLNKCPSPAGRKRVPGPCVHCEIWGLSSPNWGSGLSTRQEAAGRPDVETGPSVSPGNVPTSPLPAPGPGKLLVLQGMAQTLPVPEAFQVTSGSPHLLSPQDTSRLHVVNIPGVSCRTRTPPQSCFSSFFLQSPSLLIPSRGSPCSWLPRLSFRNPPLPCFHLGSCNLLRLGHL